MIYNPTSGLAVKISSHKQQSQIFGTIPLFLSTLSHKLRVLIDTTIIVMGVGRDEPLSHRRGVVGAVRVDRSVDVMCGWVTCEVGVFVYPQVAYVAAASYWIKTRI